jgi:glycine/D-amino acid oxidase-like deaminating enzyme
MINASFFDELEKIAEEAPGEGPGGPFITKARVKRLLIASGLTAAGAGLGTASGAAIKKWIDKTPSRQAKYMAILPAIGGAAGLAAYLHRAHTDRYIRHGNK